MAKVEVEVMTERVRHLKLPYSKMHCLAGFASSDGKNTCPCCMGQALWNKFEAWHQHSIQQTAASRIVDKALRRIAHLPLARAFYTFCDNIEKQKKLRRICNRIMHHWMNAGLAWAFDGWLQVPWLNIFASVVCNAERKIMRLKHDACEY